MYRGRLIRPFVAKIERLDASLTRSNTLSGEVAAGYDDTFREPHKVTGASGSSENARVERTLFLKCQVESESQEFLRMTPAGNNPQTLLNLVFHFCDLEKNGYVDADGFGIVKTRDRLVELKNCRGKIVARFRDPPGLYAIHAKPSGLGIGGDRNLWIVTFEERGLVPREVR